MYSLTAHALYYPGNYAMDIFYFKFDKFYNKINHRYLKVRWTSDGKQKGLPNKVYCHLATLLMIIAEKKT